MIAQSSSLEWAGPPISVYISSSMLGFRNTPPDLEEMAAVLLNLTASETLPRVRPRGTSQTPKPPVGAGFGGEMAGGSMHKKREPNTCEAGWL